MNISVCVKQVPVLSMMKFDNHSRRLLREGVPSEINHFDLLAINGAVEMKSSGVAEVSVFTMGPPQARDVLIQAMALGADNGIHLTDILFSGSDTLATSRTLALALQSREYDLIICGSHSVDSETGQVDPQIAELIQVPLVTNVTEVRIEPDSSVTAQRVTDDGVETVNFATPALITVTEGFGEERFPDTESMGLARQKTITTLTASDLAADTSLFGLKGSPTRVEEIFSISLQREQIILRDQAPNNAIDELIKYLSDKNIFDTTSDVLKSLDRGDIRGEGPMGSIWVWVDISTGAISPVSYELLGIASPLANSIGTNVAAVVLGSMNPESYSILTAFGADKILYDESNSLIDFDSASYSKILSDAISKHDPWAIILPSTSNGRELGGRTSSKLGLGMTGDCLSLRIDAKGKLVQDKPAFGGNIVAPITSNTRPYICTVRPGIGEALNPNYNTVVSLEVLELNDLPPSSFKVVNRDRFGIDQRSQIESANRVVGIGMGLGTSSHLPSVRSMAEALGAEIGCTRDVVDAGWLPRQAQIGVSGKSIAPHLYIALGIRGPFNHTVGIQKAQAIVAINTNRRAPIFKTCDFGIIGDVHQHLSYMSTAFSRIQTSLSKAD